MFFWPKKKQNIWQKLKERHSAGFLALAPMADVTDNPFRKILSEIAAPDLYYTEFVAADGLAHPVARDKLMSMLKFEKAQRPIVAQIFSHNPENLRAAAELIQKLDFNGVDLNMGCPQKNINKQICGAELIKSENRHLVTSAVKALRAGAPRLPVSLKTRLGYNQIDMQWLEFVLSHKPAALLIHLRTKKEMSKVPAHWELMTEIRELRDRISPDTVLVGNGDVLSAEDGLAKCKEHGIDGVLIGRGLFTNPWFFTSEVQPLEPAEVGPLNKTPEERIELALRHTRYFLEEYGGDKPRKDASYPRGKSFNLMKKFYKIYINGFAGAKELRIELMSCRGYEDVERVCGEFLVK